MGTETRSLLAVFSLGVAGLDLCNHGICEDHMHPLESTSTQVPCGRPTDLSIQ